MHESSPFILLETNAKQQNIILHSIFYNGGYASIWTMNKDIEGPLKTWQGVKIFVDS